MKLFERITRNAIITHASRAGVNYAFHYKKGNWSEKGECEVNKKGFSNVFYGCGLVFLCLFAFIFSIPNNLNERNAPIIYTFCALTLILNFVPGFLFRRWHFIIKDSQVDCRGLLSPGKRFPVSEITGFEIRAENDMLIYRNGEKVFVLDQSNHQQMVVDALHNHHIRSLRKDSPTFVMTVGKDLKGVLIGITIVFTGFFAWLAWMAHAFSMLMAAFFCLLFFGFITLRMSSERITFTENAIHRTMLLGKEVTLPYRKVQKVTTSQEGNTVYYCFHADGQIVLKVNMFYTYRDRMLSLISEKEWMEK